MSQVHFKLPVVCTVMLLTAITPSLNVSAQLVPARRAPMHTREESLKRFLVGQVKHKNFPGENDTRYARAFVDLNHDGKAEAIVFLVGRWLCGSGGCTTLVVTPDEDGWRLVSTVLATDIPIRVLIARSKGWRNITVWTHKTGLPPYEAELRFDGDRYPTNPTTAVENDSTGTTVIPSLAGASALH